MTSTNNEIAPMNLRSRSDMMKHTMFRFRHCVEPTGPAEVAGPIDKLRDEAIQTSRLDWIASLRSQ